MTQPLMPLDQIGAKRTGIHAGGVKQKYILTDQGRRLILATYDGKSKTIDMLAKQLGVPRWKVKNWAGGLGLTAQKEPRWTDEEIAYLEKNLHHSSLGDIAKKLNRTKTAVRLKAKRIGVNKCYQEGYTMRGLCLALGCDHHKVERWLKAGWIKGHRRRTERSEKQGDVWLFTDASIRNFIIEHPLEVDPRRIDWLWLVDVLAGGSKGLGSLSQQ